MGMGRTHEECRKKEPRKELGSSSEITKHKLGKFVGVCVWIIWPHVSSSHRNFVEFCGILWILPYWEQCYDFKLPDYLVLIIPLCCAFIFLGRGICLSRFSCGFSSFRRSFWAQWGCWDPLLEGHWKILTLLWFKHAQSSFPFLLSRVLHLIWV